MHKKKDLNFLFKQDSLSISRYHKVSEKTANQRTQQKFAMDSPFIQVNAKINNFPEEKMLTNETYSIRNILEYRNSVIR